jgi:cell division protein FtsI (penicillin-binding protein 3)
MRLAFPRPALKVPRLSWPKRPASPQAASGSGLLRRMIKSLFSLCSEKLPARLVLVALAFGGLFVVLAGRIVHLQVRSDEPTTASRIASQSISTARPQIVDRHGIVMATDIKTVSIFADPRKISDKDEAAELLNAVFPELNGNELRSRPSSARKSTGSAFPASASCRRTSGSIPQAMSAPT